MARRSAPPRGRLPALRGPEGGQARRRGSVTRGLVSPWPGWLPPFGDGLSQFASVPWTLVASLLTHRLVLLCADAHCFIFRDLPGDVLAPEPALCGWRGIIPLSLSLTIVGSGCVTPGSTGRSWWHGMTRQVLLAAPQGLHGRKALEHAMW